MAVLNSYGRRAEADYQMCLNFWDGDYLAIPKGVELFFDPERKELLKLTKHVIRNEGHLRRGEIFIIGKTTKEHADLVLQRLERFPED